MRGTGIVGDDRAELSTIYNAGRAIDRSLFSRMNRPPRLPRLPGLPGRRAAATRPGPSTEIHNYRMMRGDSVAMGIISSVSPFLPVFLVRLGGSAFEVSLLTAIPAVSGFLLAIPVGQFLQGKRRIVP